MTHIAWASLRRAILMRKCLNVILKRTSNLVISESLASHLLSQKPVDALVGSFVRSLSCWFSSFKATRFIAKLIDYLNTSQIEATNKLFCCFSLSLSKRSNLTISCFLRARFGVLQSNTRHRDSYRSAQKCGPKMFLFIVA